MFNWELGEARPQGEARRWHVTYLLDRAGVVAVLEVEYAGRESAP